MVSKVSERAQDTNGDSNYFKIRLGGITVCWDVRF